MKASEHSIQAAVIDWRETAVKQCPALKLLHAIPNGAKLSYKKKYSAMQGRVIRYSKEANKLKREGMTSGIPDLNLPVARRGYAGWWCEVKSETGELIRDQEDMIMALEAENHYVVVLRDPQEIIESLKWYLSETKC